MPNCLFCDNNADSLGHVWPKWIHDRKDFGPVKSTREDGQDRIIHNPEVTVRSVCEKCNNGWMSQLEGANIALVGNMFNDISVTMDRSQQELIAAWFMKTAMITISTRRSSNNRFYTKPECVGMAAKRKIPANTRIWLGRIETSHIMISGTDFGRFTSADMVMVAKDSIVTFSVGHLVGQVKTSHITLGFEDKVVPDGPPRGGDWGNDLIQIWPIRPDQSSHDQKFGSKLK
jgi:hypothetical protein